VWGFSDIKLLIVVGRHKRKIYVNSLVMMVGLIPFAFSITKTLENQGSLSYTHLLHVMSSSAVTVNESGNFPVSM
jgi:hypothetical protein